ncbi:HNH endonuclease signature motif containing protein [soil metagenome]
MPTSTAFASLVDPSTAFVVPAAPASDAELLELQRTLAEIRRRVDAWSAANAGRIAYRSRRELGHDGLAQRSGARTPELLIQQLVGTTARESHTMVRVGTLLAEPSALSSVGSAVSDGRLSLDAADAIRSGLSGVHPDVSTDLIAAAAESLVEDAGVVPVEKLATRARECAAELDEAHIQDRERALRDQRFLRLTPLRGGMTRLTGLLDPESAAVIVATFDAITSPRRGGPRFIDPAARDYADRLTADTRTTEQLALDSFVELIRLGGQSAPDVVGAQRPAVRVIVTDQDLHRRAGYGQIEGQRTPVSIPTIEREICDRGVIPIHVDATGQPIDLGVPQRLHTRRQRVGLAIRDGGCRFLNCDRPPSWCEAHHITPWNQGGPTTVNNGILLCRHHHLLLHDHGWNITRHGPDYYLIPPATLDPSRTPIPAPPKSQMVQRALETAQ